MRAWFTDESVGVDVGLKMLVTLSNGERLSDVPTSIKRLTQFGVVCIETLSPGIKGIRKFNQFFKQLEDACKVSGTKVIKIGRFFPSTRKCSSCGVVRNAIPTRIRIWTCVFCKAEHDRDFNAAKNIHLEGLRLLSVG